MKKKSFENIDFNDLHEIYDILGDEELEDHFVEDDQPSSAKYAKDIKKSYQKGSSIHEAVRDLVFKNTKDNFDINQDHSESASDQVVLKKRKELIEVLDNLDQEIAGKSVKEVTAIFSSLLDIQGQLCLQKTDGVISARTRLNHFFPSQNNDSGLKDFFRQEITLIFSPEEIKAIRSKLPDMDDNDPLQPFFTHILEQAYDVIQYNEMTSHLLNELSSYFINKLDENGYGNTSQSIEFKQRHERAKKSMQRALSDLRDVENVIQNNLQKYPILLEFPKLIRMLIIIKLGLMNSKHTASILQQIQHKIGAYARARSSVAFDFNRLPSFQHAVRLRQGIILNLHKDIISYTGAIFEKEFQSCKEELEQLTAEIESASEQLEPNSPEFEQLLRQKANLQKKLEFQRKKLDVVKSHERLVNVQHQLTNEAIQRFNKNEKIHQKVDEQLNQPKIDSSKTRNKETQGIKKPSRMVMAKRREK